MNREEENSRSKELAISLPIPVSDANLYNYKATDPILTYLSRRPYEVVTVSELADALSFSTSMIVRAIEPLIENDLLIESKEANRRELRINRDRLSIPDDPYFQIPQTEFQKPVHEAVQRLKNDLSGVVAGILYGSVARGEADRKSDIDLWVLVDANRSANQRKANDLKQNLDEERFDGDRYTFHIDVESVDSVPVYTDDIQRIFAEGIVLEQETDFRHVENFINEEMNKESSDE